MSTVPIKPSWSGICPWTLPLDKSRGVQGLFDGAVEIELSGEEVDTSNLSTPTVQGGSNPLLSLAFGAPWTPWTSIRVRDELDQDLGAQASQNHLGYRETIDRLRAKPDKAAYQTVSKEEETSKA